MKIDVTKMTALERVRERLSSGIQSDDRHSRWDHPGLSEIKEGTMLFIFGILLVCVCILFPGGMRAMVGLALLLLLAVLADSIPSEQPRPICSYDKVTKAHRTIQQGECAE